MVMVLIYETFTFKNIWNIFVIHIRRAGQINFQTFQELNGKGREIWKDPAEHFITIAVKTRRSLIESSPLSETGPSAITI